MASSMSQRRARKVEQSIQRELAILLQREIKDPRIGFINITRVKITDDLRFARVYWSLLGDDSEAGRSDTNKGLRAAKGYLRNHLKVLRLRYLPEITFHYDSSGEDAERIGNLIDSLKPVEIIDDAEVEALLSDTPERSEA